MKDFPKVDQVFLVKRNQDLIFYLDEAQRTLNIDADAFDVTEISKSPAFSDLYPFSVVLYQAIFNEIDSFKTVRVTFPKEQLIVDIINNRGVIPYFHDYQVYILENKVAIWLVLEP